VRAPQGSRRGRSRQCVRAPARVTLGSGPNEVPSGVKGVAHREPPNSSLAVGPPVLRAPAGVNAGGRGRRGAVRPGRVARRESPNSSSPACSPEVRARAKVTSRSGPNKVPSGVKCVAHREPPNSSLAVGLPVPAHGSHRGPGKEKGAAGNPGSVDESTGPHNSTVGWGMENSRTQWVILEMDRI
jgi:hypothetical protein